MDLDWGQKPEETQNSPAWLEWRRKKLGASDGPIIMGKSPWKTPHALWLEKTGQLIPEPAGFPAERGHMLEPYARDKYNSLYKAQMKPKTFIHPEMDFLSCSMDGWDAPFGCEIKCPMSDKDHLVAKGGQVPDKYIFQLVHQFICTNAEWIDYFSYYVKPNDDPENGDWATVRFARDAKLEKEYLKQAKKFWKLVETNVAPPLGESDFQDVQHSDFAELVEDFKDLSGKLEQYKKALELTKEQITDYGNKRGFQRFKGFGLKVTPVTKKGNVDYSKVPVLSGLDLDPFRKPESTYFKFTLEKGK